MLTISAGGAVNTYRAPAFASLTINPSAQQETAPMNTMKQLVLAFVACSLIAILAASSAVAETMPAPPSDAVPMQTGECRDNETGQLGRCIVLVQPNHHIWLIFYQNGEAQFMRWVQPGLPYETVWKRSTYAAY